VEGVAIRVAAVELPARWNEPASALADVERLLTEGGPADLVLLPETSLTGYVSPAKDFDLTPFAEPVDGPTARALAGLAVRHRCHLAGPLVECEGDALYNTVLVFAPDGTRVARYRKRHPWVPETWATAGAEAPPVFDVAGARVTMAVCFDVQFVAEDAADELRAADVLLFPSAWVERPDSRGIMLPALAARFDVAVVNANWGPGTPRVPGQGGSRIVDRRGATAALAEAAREGGTEAGPRAVRIDAVL
jgi:predicted amidohydrolase